MNPLLIEKFNLVTTLSCLLKSGSKDLIYVMDSMPYYESNTNQRNIYEKFFKFFARGKKVIRLPLYEEQPIKKDFNSICWRANKITLEFIESEHFHNKLRIFLNPLIESVGNQNVEIALKKLYMNHVYQKVLFLLQIEEISKTSNDIEVMHTEIDHFKISDYLNLNSDKQKSSLTFNLFQYFFDNFKSILLLISSPYIFRDIFRRGLRINKIHRRSYETAIHLTFGFPSADLSTHDKMKRLGFGDEIYFKYGFLDARKNIFVQGRWSIPENLNKTYSKKIDQLGCSFVNDNLLRIPIRFLLQEYLWKGYLRPMIRYLLILFKKNNLPSDIILASERIYLSYLQHMVFCEYFKVKVFLSRDDYDVDHILRTIVQEKYSTINAGLQHSALIGPVLLPFSAHVFFHRYYISGNGLKEMWRPYWDSNISMKSVGPHRDNSVLEALNDKDISQRFKEKYKRKKTVLLLFSHPDEKYSPTWLLRRKYKGIEKILELDNSLHIIVRPRLYQSVIAFKDMFPELKKFVDSGRISIEIDDFTTQELVANSDICIAEDGSSLLIESCFIDTLYLISLNSRYPTHSFLEAITAENMDEITIMISNFLERGIPNEARETYKYLQDNYTVQPSGKTWFRIAEDINNKYLKPNVS